MALQIHRELVVRGEPERVQDFERQLESTLRHAWSRDPEAEAGLGIRLRMLCFALAPQERHPAVKLWFASRGVGELFVSNIVPTERPTISRKEYNAVLTEFYQEFVSPAANACGVEAVLGKDELQLKDVMSAEAARDLRLFSTMANRLVLHPLDDRRLEEFIIAAHREGAKFDAATLKRWLCEEENWPEEAAARVAITYEEGRSLLKSYDEKFLGAGPSYRA